ncbi:MAG: internal scaffolding protein [Arizlama microvirus]|nr:MAG: internal scaffolding protein [Arizlama microvirus]
MFRPRERVSLKFTKPSRTKQAHKDECDINLIVPRYSKTGLVTHLNRASPSFADVTSFGDYAESLQTVVMAQDSFMQLPATLRARFGNDPAQFVSFCSNPANKDELISLGLAVPAASASNSAGEAVGAGGPAEPPPKPSKAKKNPSPDGED